MARKNPHSTRQNLIEILQGGTQLLTELKSLLEAERQHLEQNAYSEVQATVAKKQNCLDRTQQHETALQDFFKAQGIASDKIDLNQLAADFDPKPESTLATTVRHYETLLNECNTLNTINGQIIQRAQVNAVNLLNVIKGAVKKNETYTRAGKTRSNPDNQPIARA